MNDVRSAAFLKAFPANHGISKEAAEVIKKYFFCRLMTSGLLPDVLTIIFLYPGQTALHRYLVLTEIVIKICT